jgi:hypothetical protein
MFAAWVLFLDKAEISPSNDSLTWEFKGWINRQFCKRSSLNKALNIPQAVAFGVRTKAAIETLYLSLR